MRRDPGAGEVVFTGVPLGPLGRRSFSVSSPPPSSKDHPAGRARLKALLTISNDDDMTSTPSIRSTTSVEAVCTPVSSLAGWDFQNVTLSVTDMKYDTNFGDPRVTANAEAYTHLNARIHVKRPIGAHW